MKRLLAFAFALTLSAPAVAQQYRFPMELPSSGTQPYVTAYRDLDTSGGLQDWNCETKTYNGHKGSDFGIGSFPVMDAGSRWVVAAAPGTVSFVNDGCFDRCTTGDCACGSGFGNYVRIQHADGKLTYYAHMMDGSITVAVGDQVSCGQHLGKVGSSGFSTGPHLHFEPRYSDNVSDDPFSGPCGGPSSFWVSQGAYMGLPGDGCDNAPSQVDDAKLVSETLPDGTLIEPGASFKKSWTLENIGTTSWTKAGGYLWTHDADETFSGAAQVELGDAESIAPGGQKTWTVSLVAPSSPGTYRGYFRMDHSGVGRFGDQVHVEIVVSDSAAGGAGGGSATGGSGWGATSNGGNGGSSGGHGTSVIKEEQGGGCGCRLAGDRSSRTELMVALALAGLALRRRRR